MKLARRLTAIRKLLLQRNPYVLISLKPPEMLQPRSGDYVYGELERRFAVLDDAFTAELERLEPSINACSGAVEIDGIRHPDPAEDNGYFWGLDARIAYAVARSGRPRRIVEIGSGNSTRLFRRAASEGAYDCHIVSIDPEPRVGIDQVADEIRRYNLLDAEPEVFAALGPGDILFMDGSHIALNGTDVPPFFLEILPALQPGVLVHVHDIMLPYEYNKTFSERSYSEQYVLAALLLGDAGWVPMLPVHYLLRHGVLAGSGSGTSFWMRRA